MHGYSRWIIRRTKVLSDIETPVGDLRNAVREFIHERDWEQYHNPKDIAEAICIEAAELLQLFQWTKSEESRKVKTGPSTVKRVREELADVFIYCLSLANTLEVDLTKVVLEKLELNKKKYPADIYKGKVYLNHQEK